MTSKTILVVDDDPLSSTALVDLLVRNGYEPVEAHSGAAALDVFRAGEFLAVITDLRMPKMDGIELLRRIRAKDSVVPVVVVTAYGSVHSAVEAMKEGATEYVTKPFASHEILAVLTRQSDLRRLRDENRTLRLQIGTRFGYSKIVGRSQQMKAVFDLVGTVTDSLSTVLIHGESGTGKELVARALHNNSHRANGPFIAVSCAALTETLLESELFGHEKGSFTGATAAKPGRIELADGGTLFLDDIDDVPLSAQVKLLRVLQEREVERVGTTKPRRVDVRVVTATKIDLLEAVQAKRFRDDLYYRLSVIPIRIPPLRERKDDIPLLAVHFLELYSERDGRETLTLAPECLQVLESHHWPGNVRELENVIERLVATCPGATCGLESIPKEIVDRRLEGDRPTPDAFPDSGIELLAELDHLETRIIRWALAKTGGNKSQMARLLHLSRSTLADHMTRLKLGSDLGDETHE